MVWWLIPILATLIAYVFLRFAGSTPARRRRPEPGTPEDRAELARLAEALDQPLPGQRRPGGRP